MNASGVLLFAVVFLFSVTCANRRGRYGQKDDDYYEQFYLRKIPKLKVSPAKVQQFFTNHLSWFPMNELDENAAPRRPAPGSYHRPVYKSIPRRYHHDDSRNVLETAKNFTAKHMSMAILKNDTAKMTEYLNKTHIGEKLKNITHVFRPRTETNHTTHHKYMMPTESTVDPCRFILPIYWPTKTAKIGPIEPTIRIHRRKALEAPKLEPHPKNDTEPSNSSQVLETAEDIATDLAGRVTNLWKCVVGYKKNPNIRDVNYFLYTRRNIVEPELIAVNYKLIKNMTANAKGESVECAQIQPDEIEDFLRISDENRKIISSNFLSLRAPTKILIHGYTGSYKDSRMAKIKDAYLSTGRFNVIQVDWEGLAAPPCYIHVTHHARFVGQIVAQFIDGLFLVGLNRSLLHLVGFSLGAQVAGLAGNLVTLGKICRITGLDPALPLFLHTDSADHLDKFDADFVDVIHTCGGILAMFDPIGHVDFYPNGGRHQPGCELSNLKCSHSRAPQYFAESIASDRKFIGEMCPSWESFLEGCNSSAKASMGEPCSIRSQEGKYYLTTQSREPFAV